MLASDGAADLAVGSALTPAVQFEAVTKDYPGQRAVDGVSFSVMPGEVHALVGENGAGKSTLLKILAGNVQPTSGVVRIKGEPCVFHHPRDAADRGVGVVHQDPALFPSLSVAENLAVGRTFETRALGIISWKRQREVVKPALERVGLHVEPSTLLRDLTTHQRQLVALAKLLLDHSRVVVLDEVTAPLTQPEVRRLFALVRELRAEDVAVIYVSHRLQEVFDLADVVTVMRNGRHISTESVTRLTERALTRMIIGSDTVTADTTVKRPVVADPVLNVEGLTDEVLRGVSFSLNRGEILGLAGLAGAGRTNVLECIYGLRRRTGGSVYLRGKELPHSSPPEAVRTGVALVTEERRRDGYVASFTVRENITLPWLAQFTKFGLINLADERNSARRTAEEFDVRTPSLETPIAYLSGGNQQKAILARWLSHPIAVLLLDEPTHGVDVGARAKIYEMVRQIAQTGVAVILVSSELEELEGLCSRVLLMAEGRVVGELLGAEIEKDRMLSRLYSAMSEVAGA